MNEDDIITVAEFNEPPQPIADVKTSVEQWGEVVFPKKPRKPRSPNKFTKAQWGAWCWATGALDAIGPSGAAYCAKDSPILFIECGGDVVVATRNWLKEFNPK